MFTSERGAQRQRQSCKSCSLEETADNAVTSNHALIARDSFGLSFTTGFYETHCRAVQQCSKTKVFPTNFLLGISLLLFVFRILLRMIVHVSMAGLSSTFSQVDCITLLQSSTKGGRLCTSSRTKRRSTLTNCIASPRKRGLRVYPNDLKQG